MKKVVKNLGGRGKLTNKIIDRLQNYHGIADYHAHCPPGDKSWCRYQSDKATGLSKYKPGLCLTIEVIKHVKPVYNELSKDELLEKCLQGNFNALIWERLPKRTYVSLTNLRLGTYDAVAHFNMGKKSSILIYYSFMENSVWCRVGHDKKLQLTQQKATFQC